MYQGKPHTAGRETAKGCFTLKNIWPSVRRSQRSGLKNRYQRKCSAKSYRHVYEGEPATAEISEYRNGNCYDWETMRPTFILKKPPFFDDMSIESSGIPSIKGARCFSKLWTQSPRDIFLPAGAIKRPIPPARLSEENGVEKSAV